MVRKKCLLLLNHNKDDKFYIDEIKKISKNKNFRLFISDNFKIINKTFDFVFCINYPKIIPKKYIDSVKNGIYVFHSSDLPEGRGWAPIYHSILSNKKNHVLTMIKINEKVDRGEIIAKAYFKKREGENADSLREVDNIMTIKIIKKVIDDLLLFRLKGKKQTGRGSYCPKRSPSDSEVKAEDSLKKIHYHCLAVTDEYPAFYYYKNKKYIIKIRPESLEELNEGDIKIVTFYEKYPAQ